MRFTQINIVGFAPFKDQQLTFPAAQPGEGEVHLFVGENGTGKTRLLSILMAAMGNPMELQARDAGWHQGQSIVNAVNQSRQLAWPQMPANEGSPLILKGFLEILPTQNCFAFRGVASVADTQVEAMKPVKLGERKEHLTFQPHQQENHIIGQAITNLKMSTAMDSLQQLTDTRSTKMMTRLESVLSTITGRKFDFRVNPMPNVHLSLRWGESDSILLNQAPDGLRALIGTLGACVAKLDAFNPTEANPLDLPVILFFDEPETHLHPRWQRQLLPGLQALLPNAQIFMATHSPFIISSANTGSLHVFQADAKGEVRIATQPCSPGDSYLDVIEDILGVREWYDVETEGLLAKFRAARKAALNGDAQQEQELRNLAGELGRRSPSLANTIGGEMRNFERLNAQKAS